MNNPLQDMYYRHLDATHDEKRAATLTITELAKVNPELFDALNEQAEECTFTVRRYGNQFYAWVHHPSITGAIDPWPSSKWPKAVLCVTLGLRLTTSTL